MEKCIYPSPKRYDFLAASIPSIPYFRLTIENDTPEFLSTIDVSGITAAGTGFKGSATRILPQGAYDIMLTENIVAIEVTIYGGESGKSVLNKYTINPGQPFITISACKHLALDRTYT